MPVRPVTTAAGGHWALRVPVGDTVRVAVRLAVAVRVCVAAALPLGVWLALGLLEADEPLLNVAVPVTGMEGVVETVGVGEDVTEGVAVTEGVGGM